MLYSIGEAAERTGLSTYTLRYYDKEGLLPFVGRTETGIRNFSESDLEWLGLICCLKNTGMSIHDIRIFMQWCAQGDSTLEQRRQMFLDRRKAVEQQIADLQKTLKKIDCKIDYYEKACAAGTESVVKDCCKPIFREDMVCDQHMKKDPVN